MHTEKIRVFISYAREDAGWCEELKKHLELADIPVWYDHEKVRADTDWTKYIQSRINEAPMILLLISADFMASDYCYDVELQQALRRHETEQVSVIPILMSPVDFEDTPLNHFRVLPNNGRAITSWPDRKEAFTDVVKDIQKLFNDLFVVENAHDERKQEPPLESVQVFTKDPASTSKILEQAQLLRQSKHYEEALLFYEQVLSLAPQEALLYRYKGDTLQQLGRYEEALAAYERGLFLTLHDPILLSKKWNALQLLGRHEQALEVYKHALTVVSGSALEDIQEWMPFEIEQYEEALATFDHAIDSVHEKYHLYSERGKILEKVARVQYQKYVRLAQQAYQKARQLKERTS